MLRTAIRTFGVPIVYIRGAQLTPLTNAVFDANYQEVDPETGAIISSVGPMLGVRALDLPELPQSGHQVSVSGVLYHVINVQPDSEGRLNLILHKVLSD